MENDVILSMEHIVRVFPGVKALDDVGFDLCRGEVHVLLGENGAGKSTLIRILSGAVPMTSGRIVLDGSEISIRNPRHARALGISTIHQELHLVPQLSVAQNIFLGREPCLAPGVIDCRALESMAQDILNRLAVELDVRASVRTLGIAQKQMVEVAKALSLDCRILVMDEPTSALSDQEISELFSLIRRMKSAGVSVIYISHRLDEVIEIGDRVTVLRDGRSKGTRPVKDASKGDLIRMMVNRDFEELFPRKKTAPGDKVLRLVGLGRKGVLEDISFSLCQGEIVGMAGLVGSGRTELARILFGLDNFDSGRIEVKGRAAAVRSPRDAIRLGFGFLTEDRKTQGLVLKLSVKDNICLPSVGRFSCWGIMSRREENRAADGCIRDLAIKTPGPLQRVMALSGGNQQKVVLGKWRCSKADILIFDEPTRGIDVGSKVEIYQWMNRLTQQGKAILMISSEIPEILGMSDRILVMHRGRISAEFSRAEATQEKILKRALGVADE